MIKNSYCTFLSWFCIKKAKAKVKLKFWVMLGSVYRCEKSEPTKAWKTIVARSTTVFGIKQVYYGLLMKLWISNG